MCIAIDTIVLIVLFAEVVLIDSVLMHEMEHAGPWSDRAMRAEETWRIWQHRARTRGAAGMRAGSHHARTWAHRTNDAARRGLRAIRAGSAARLVHHR